jgi:hypothetical protein
MQDGDLVLSCHNFVLFYIFVIFISLIFWSLFAFLFKLCYDFIITDSSVLFSMDTQQSQKLIDALTPLIGYWEYAEVIIANIHN